MSLDGVAQRQIAPYLISVATTAAETPQIAGVHQIRHDPLHGSFGNPYPLSNLAHSCLRILCDAQQYMRMVG